MGSGARGKIVKESTIPAREYLTLEVKKGQILRFIDIEGQQVIDVTIFNLNDLTERSSCWHTRGVNETWRITEAHSIYSQRCNKMYTIIDDKVGKNVYDGGFCTEEINYVRYGIKGTRNCRDNLTMAVAPYGLTKKDIQEDGNCGLMMDMAPTPDGSYLIHEPIKQPDRYIDLLAEMDLLVAISNCPQDRNPCNAFNPTPVKIIIYERS
ncbi:DUF1989 domain-containing protein [Chloroflexota bacterium]